MPKAPKTNSKHECPVCYLAHDDEIHEATVRLRQWFGGYVTRSFQVPAAPAPELQPKGVAA